MCLVLAFAALAAFTGCVDAIVGSDPVVNVDSLQNRSALFDELWSEVDAHYSFFQLKNINWDSLKTVYGPRARAAANDRELATALAKMLCELRDPHVEITPFGQGSTMRYLSLHDTVNTQFSAQKIVARYLPGLTFATGQRLRYGMIEPGIGYLQIATFQGTGWSAEVDAALEQVKGAKQLIVDVRDNSGGTYAMALDVAGRFTTTARKFGYLRFRNGLHHDDFTSDIPEVVKPSNAVHFGGTIILLTNSKTASAAENFVLAMRSMPGVAVVGDSTAGTSGGPTPRELANGWVFQLSEWVEYTLEHKTYEEAGLGPDIFVNSEANGAGNNAAANALQFTDPTIERALQRARSAILTVGIRH